MYKLERGPYLIPIRITSINGFDSGKFIPGSVALFTLLSVAIEDELQMTAETDSSGSSLLTDRRLRVVYVIGIALNVIALTSAAAAGERLIAFTFCVVIAYLCFRYWMTVKGTGSV